MRDWIERLLSDHQLEYVAEGHKHVTAGWTNIHCPFCRGPRNFHLGIRADSTACHCWRCGGHSLTSTLATALRLPAPQVRTLIEQYRKTHGGRTPRAGKEPTVRIAKPFKFPRPNGCLSPAHKQYLASRGFDPEQLEADWGLLGTGPSSWLDGLAYSHRILIPINWNNEIVSFQARDITRRSDLKYLACPKRREVIHHKNVLYGKQQEWSRSGAVIIVEGVTDVWRLGPAAAATFGIEFKLEQVLQLSRHHQRFVIVFDNEPQAQQQAGVLAARLRALGKHARIATVETDPGAMKQDDADSLVAQLIARNWSIGRIEWTNSKALSQPTLS